MSAHYIAALDQGTTSTRCMIFDRQGRMVAIAQREHHQYYPHPGWVEHDAAEIWSIVQRIVPQALHDAGVGPEQIVGVGDDQPARDDGAVEPAHRQAGRPGDRLAGHPDGRAAAPDRRGPRPGASSTPAPDCRWPTTSRGPKMRWLLDETRAARAAEEGDLLFGTMDSWLCWNLTGRAANGAGCTSPTSPTPAAPC